jgi:hypothetical protein
MTHRLITIPEVANELRRGSGANRHTSEIAAGMRADQLPGPPYASDPIANSIFV